MNSNPCFTQGQLKKKVKKKERGLDFADCIVTTPHHPPPTLNFSNTSRGPRRHCNTFLRSYQHPLLKSKRKKEKERKKERKRKSKRLKVKSSQQMFSLDNVDSRLVS